jgi:hypothetical protein
MKKISLILVISLIVITCSEQKKPDTIMVKDSVSAAKPNPSQAVSQANLDSSKNASPVQAKQTELTKKDKNLLPEELRQKQPPPKPEDSPYKNSTFKVTVINSIDNTFGYDLFIDGRQYIHQPSVPGLPGNKGFASKEQANSVANLVIKKIKNNMMPPTVTKEELDSLGVR